MKVSNLACKTAHSVFDWTGIPPVSGQCPGVKPDNTITSLPQVRLDSSRKAILDYFNNSWALTEVLFSGLANEAAYYRRPYHHLRHPMIFYYGHVAVLYVNKLRVAGLLDKPLNAAFENLFEVGVDEMRWDDLHEGAQHIWPPLAEVRAYRKQVYKLIRNLIETHPLLEPDRLPITQDSPMWALVMGFEHERIHLETSSVLMREMPLENLRKPKEWPDFIAGESGKTSPNAMISVPASGVSLGKPHDFPTFGWDNEYGSEVRQVRPFAASRQLISNDEFLEFVKAGGYAEEQYWSRDGWSWRRFRNVKWPAFWVQDGPAGSHLYKLRTIFEIIDMQPGWPVIVNFHEAKAYCAWRSGKDGGMPYRLLTEAEHNALRDGHMQDYNIGLVSGGESAVDALPANSKGFHDVFGNVWQWCEDHFHPLTGAKPHPYYDDFSAPCYDGEHQMILGGSFISTGDEASRFARFHFRPHFFQHAGFRIARSEDGNPACDAKLLKNTAVHPFHAWSQSGWLASDRYYQFWGEILSEKLRPYLENRHVADIGAGNGKIWEAAFHRGLPLKHLTLIDPHVSASGPFLESKHVSIIRLPLAENGVPVSADTLFFKQSFHLVFNPPESVTLPNGTTNQHIIVLYMGRGINWPVSEKFKMLHAASCSDPCEWMPRHGKKLVLKTRFSFPVRITRQQWIEMIANRFSSCLHALNAREIESEITWIDKNTPDELYFDDTLECAIFK